VFSSGNVQVVFSEPVLNGSGQTAFSALLSGPGVNGSNDIGIWSEGGGSGLALVAREGSPAPDTGSGVNFSDFFGDPVLNGKGQTAFIAWLGGTGINSTNNSGIWSEGGGSGLALIARRGSPAPGTESDVNFDRFFRPPVMNGSGQMAFTALLNGPGVEINTNRSGIWSEGGGSGLALVAREGSPAPGTEIGVNFISYFSEPVLNNSGQTAFSASLSGTGVDGSNNSGIWAEDLSGNLCLIVRKGDLLDVDDGPGVDFRVIRSLGVTGATGNEDGRRSHFNDLGQLAFQATFYDDTEGIFVSNLVATIPEPSTLLLGALASVGLLMRRRSLR
jgi:hypothetical protein